MFLPTLVHHTLPVTTVDWQFNIKPWLRVCGHGFSFAHFAGSLPPTGDNIHRASGGGNCAPDDSVQNGNSTEIRGEHYGLV